MSAVIYGRILKAGRVLTGVSQRAMAKIVNSSQRTIARLEEDQRQLLNIEVANKVRDELERRGVEFTDATDAHGIGVRFKSPDNVLLVVPTQDETK